MGAVRYYLPNASSGSLATLGTGAVGPWNASGVIPIHVAPTAPGTTANALKVGNGSSSTYQKHRVWGWVTAPQATPRTVSRVRVVTRCEHWLAGTKALALRVLDIDGNIPANSTQLTGNDVVAYATSGSTTANGYSLYAIDVVLQTPVVVAAGRRLFFELGGDMQPGGSGNALYIEAGETGNDLPFTHGLAAPNPMGRGWVEVTYDDTVPAVELKTKRFYLSSSGSGASTPPITPPQSGLWQNGATGSWALMSETKANTAFASRTIAETVAGSAYAGAYNFVTPALPAGIQIARVRVCLQASSGSGSSLTYLAANVRTVNADDLTTAEEIFSGHGGGPSGAAFAFVTREISIVTDTLVDEGQHLAVETGLYCVNTVSTSMGGAIKLGDPTVGADAAVGDTGENRGWVEIEYTEEPVTYTNHRFYLANNGTVGPGAAPLGGLWNADTAAGLNLLTAPEGALANSSRSTTAVAGTRTRHETFRTVVPKSGVLSGFINSAIGTRQNAAGSNARLAIVARVMSADNTITRGILFNGVDDQGLTVTASHAGAGPRQLTGVLTEVSGVEPGDHLVVDIGTEIANTTSGGGVYLYHGSNTAYPDYPSQDGINMPDYRSWVDFQFAEVETALPVYLGSTEISKLYLGSSPVDAAALGGIVL